MYAVEFEAYLKNGVINVPEKIKSLGDIDSAKFIMMFEEEKKKRPMNKEKMSAISIDTKGFKFNREEAHER